MEFRPSRTAHTLGVLVLVLTTAVVSAQEAASEKQTIGLGSAFQKVIVEQRFHLSQSMTLRDLPSDMPGVEWDDTGFVLDETLAPFSTLSIYNDRDGKVSSFEVSTDLIRPSQLNRTILNLFEDMKWSISDVLGVPNSDSVKDIKDQWLLGSTGGRQTKIIAAWFKEDHVECILRYDETGDDSGFFTLLLAVPK